ncbi:hypothetical protein [Flavobacterium sp. HNIBRBA15423]|uniref:hypothetical protein n=1 Tax=Flavobacterium sp. HNIBRBA15423 TaxID=3458683 RepID=UPI0040450CB9
MPFQDWDHPQKIEFNWRKTTSIPSSINFLLKIRDIIGEPEAVGYTDFEFRIFGSASWLTLSGDFTTGTYYPISTTGMTGNISLQPTSLINTFNSSQKYASYILQVTGKSPEDITNGTRTILSFSLLNIYLNVYAYEQPILTPYLLPFTHYHQTLVPDFQEMNVDAIGSWGIFLPGTSDRYEVNVISGDLLVEVLTIYGSTTKKISGNGSGVFEIRPSQVYLDSLTVGSFSDVISFGFNPDWYNFISNLTIDILEPIDILATPAALSFYAIKTILEAPIQALNIQALYDFTLEFPIWAVPSVTSGVVGSNDIDVGVVPSDAIDAGTYTGNIIVSYDNGNGIQQFLIPITYIVDGFIILPYSTTEFNFTLDNKFVSFYSDLENTFFDMLMNIKVFDFFTGLETIFIIPLKIVLLRNRQKENIGLKIHRVMKRILELDFSSQKIYKTCEVDITVEEKDLETKEVQRDFTLEKVKFIAGISPKSIIDGMAILSIYDGPTRVLVDSIQTINLLIKAGSYVVQIIVNNTMSMTYSVSGQDYNVIMDQIDFSSLEIKPGDVIEYRLYTTLVNYLSKTFYVFPDNVESLRVVWEDEYKLISSLQFTGDYKVISDFDIRTFKKYKDLVEIVENIKTDKEIKLSLNTGFILKSEQILVESLVRSRRAWLVLENQNIELIPQTKSMINIDSSRELNSYNLEFIINRTSNEEIYNF